MTETKHALHQVFKHPAPTLQTTLEQDYIRLFPVSQTPQQRFYADDYDLRQPFYADDYDLRQPFYADDYDLRQPSALKYVPSTTSPNAKENNR